MSNAPKKNNRQILREKVVALVKEFVKTEGGITQNDLKDLFGQWPHQEVAAALAEMTISLT